MAEVRQLCGTMDAAVSADCVSIWLKKDTVKRQELNNIFSYSFREQKLRLDMGRCVHNTSVFYMPIHEASLFVFKS